MKIPPRYHKLMQEVKIFSGGISRDERGNVRFVNDFHFKKVKRFYQVENSNTSVVRAFHGHMKESKYVYVVKGDVLFCVVKLSDTRHPSKEAIVKRFRLSAREPQVLYVPPGYANGFRSLTKGASVIFFSTSSLEESKADDYRFDPYYWGDVWKGRL